MIDAIDASLPARTLKSPHWEKLATAQHILRWQHQALTFLIFRKSDSQYIGTCIFSGFVWGPFRSCNFGYHIDGSVEGQGYMKEAATTALDSIFNQWDIRRVVANYDEKNIRSGKLLERLGFEVEGCARDWIEIENARRNAITTALLRSDWERRVRSTA